MQEKPNMKVTEVLAEELKTDLLKQYGPLLTGDVLRKVLGYRSMAAMNMAVQRGTLTLPIFKIKNRRGKFALTKEVACWLVEQRNSVSEDVVLPTMETKEGGSL